MKENRHASLLWLAITILAIFAFVPTANGQDGPPDIPSFPTPPGSFTPPTNPSVPNRRTTGGGGGGGGSQTGNSVNLGDGAVDPSNVQIQTSKDIRNQGFIGATAPGIQSFGYIGAVSGNSGPPLAPQATFGGGVNGSRTTGSSRQISGGGFGGGGNRLVGQQGFGAAGAQNGFSIFRRSLRTRLSPSFIAPEMDGQQISNRFASGFQRLPASQNFSGQYQISIANQTATIRGSVGTQSDADHLVRQLRLQPGVYRIDNQLQVTNGTHE